MRKFVIQKVISPDTFNMTALCDAKVDGEIMHLAKVILNPIYDGRQFSIEEIAMIEAINASLLGQGQSMITAEEALTAFSCFDLPKTEKDANPKDMQRLAGFAVEKKIIYYDDIEAE